MLFENDGLSSSRLHPKVIGDILKKNDNKSLFKCGYIFSDNENEAEIEKQVSHRYNINRPMPRQGNKHTKYKMCLSIMMVLCIKPHLSNTWSSSHKKVKQHWGWVEKKRCL